MKKKWILPAAAALAVAIAVLVIVLVPRNNSSASPYAERNAEAHYPRWSFLYKDLSAFCQEKMKYGLNVD